MILGHFYFKPVSKHSFLLKTLVSNSVSKSIFKNLLTKNLITN